jgi:pimeloyl-ACP methyl ester carboxylesterase
MPPRLTFRFKAIRPALTAIIAVWVTLGLMTGQLASAHPANTSPISATKTQAKPTIVLEHGAWADSSSWDGVILWLQRAGYTVYAPPNPLNGLPYDAQYLADFLATIAGPIVLVGHSYGGTVISNAATGDRNVKALVYVDAFIPAQGETLGQLVAGTGSCLGGNPANVFKFVPYPGGPPKDVKAYVQQKLFPSCFANDLPAKTGAVLAATQNPLAISALSEKSGRPAWKKIPSWSVIGTVDRVLPPAKQVFMSMRAKAHIVKVRASHLSLVSRPGVVAGVIIAAAKTTT